MVLVCKYAIYVHVQSSMCMLIFRLQMFTRALIVLECVWKSWKFGIAILWMRFDFFFLSLLVGVFFSLVKMSPTFRLYQQFSSQLKCVRFCYILRSTVLFRLFQRFFFIFWHLFFPISDETKNIAKWMLLCGLLLWRHAIHNCILL